MERAYDLHELGKRLKDAGLIEVEDMALKAYDIVKEWLKESAVFVQLQSTTSLSRSSTSLT